MTSKCSQSASATRCDSSASRAKSADSRLGAIIGSRDTSAESRWAAEQALPAPYAPRRLRCPRDGATHRDGVAVRVAALCLEPSGRAARLAAVRPRRARRRCCSTWRSPAGWMSTEDSIVVDPTPTGLRPGRPAARRDRGRARTVAGRLAGRAADRAARRRRRRTWRPAAGSAGRAVRAAAGATTDLHPEQTARDRARSRRTGAADRRRRRTPASPSSAAAAGCSTPSSGCRGGRRRELLAATGPAAWLGRRRRRPPAGRPTRAIATQAGALGAGIVGPF